MRQVSDILDTTTALAGVGGDREFFWELLGIFRAAWPTLLHEIREGLVKEDLRRVEGAAHLLKFAAQNVAARRVCLAALRLEQTATSGDLEGARQACSLIEEEIDQLELALVSIGDVISGLRRNDPTLLTKSDPSWYREGAAWRALNGTGAPHVNRTPLKKRRVH